MKCFVVLAVLAAVSQAQFYGAGFATPYGAGIAHRYGYAAPIAARPYLAAAPIHHAPAAPLLNAAPIHHAPAAPLLKAAPVPASGVHATQYHAQDEFGQYEFGYDNPTSSRREKGQAGLGVTGTYSYVDGHGINQKVDYVADAYGFRTTGTNFPNTPATSAIKAPYYAAPGFHHLGKRQAIFPAATAPLAYSGLAHPAPLAYAGLAHPGPVAYAGLAHPAPVAYAGHAHAAVVQSAPAAREADLLRIQNNPGHAVSYRVY